MLLHALKFVLRCSLFASFCSQAAFAIAEFSRAGQPGPRCEIALRSGSGASRGYHARLLEQQDLFVMQSRFATPKAFAEFGLDSRSRKTEFKIRMVENEGQIEFQIVRALGRVLYRAIIPPEVYATVRVRPGYGLLRQVLGLGGLLPGGLEGFKYTVLAEQDGVRQILAHNNRATGSLFRLQLDVPCERLVEFSSIEDQTPNQRRILVGSTEYCRVPVLDFFELR